LHNAQQLTANDFVSVAYLKLRFLVSF